MKTIVYIRSTNIYDDSRATKEINALLESGYYVVVLGWDRDGNAKRKSQEVFLNYKERVCLFFFSVVVYGGIGLKNIDILVSWLIWVLKTVRNYTKKHEVHVIHACNLDAALSIWYYGKKKKIKLIYDIYDYYIDSHNIPKWLSFFIEKLEINIINNANVTIICTEERREQIKKSVPKEVLVIHNSPDVTEVGESSENYDYVYCGALFSGRLVQEIFRQYPQNQDLNFGIGGYGVFEKEAIELQKKFHGFTYFGTLTYDEVLQRERETKVISAIYEPNIRNHRLCAPNKFYEALALGKPIIVCRGTGIDEIVEQYGLGIVINYNADEFYSALRRLIQDDDERRRMGMRARRLYLQEYKWENMKERLISCYRKIEAQ